MATAPLITFKAGRCDFSGRKVHPRPQSGYLYLYAEDDLLHLCWRPRSALSTEPELDLVMIPGDGTFQPLLKEQGAENLHSPTTGRIFVLKFSSSSERYFFWMQSKTQHREGSLSWFSQRDQRLGQIVDLLLQGEDVNVQQEIDDIRQGGEGGGGGGGGGGGDDSGPNGDADAMELDRDAGFSRQETGGAGADATGGDPREEGEASREGGADGGRAATTSSSSSRPQDTDALVQNFLNSLKTGGASGGAPPPDKPYTTLADLLNTSTTIPYIDAAPPSQIDHLCTLLPPELFLLAQQSAADPSSSDPKPTSAAGEAAIEALTVVQKKGILQRVLRSPQLHQSLGNLTVALRDGGLPMIGEALGLEVENRGFIQGGSMPLGGGDAVEAFVEGVKKTVEDEGKAGENTGGGDGGGGGAP